MRHAARIPQLALIVSLALPFATLAPAAADAADAPDGSAAKPPAERPAGDSRTGWFGETMPEGLVRGEKEKEYVWAKDRAVMVYVAAGPFTMGTDAGEPTDRPAHRVELDGFYIDKYEVSWRKWKASGLPYLDEPNDRLSVVQAPDWRIHDAQPVVNVAWPDAKSYAAWSGKRLPTEAEWEKAARGTDGREYPWGSEPPSVERAMWVDHPLSRTSTAPINCCAAGASPYGAFNMAGNVWEWCEDTFRRDFYAHSPLKSPVNLEAGDAKVLRGGAMQLDPKFLRTYSRYWLSIYDRVSDIGLRTVVSGVVPPTSPEPAKATPAPASPISH